MKKCDLSKSPLSNYYKFIKEDKEPYASVWRTAVNEIVDYYKITGVSEGTVYLLDTRSIEKKVRGTITKRNVLKRLKSSSVNRTIAAGLLTSNLREGGVILSNNKDFFRNKSAGKTKYHVKVNKENILKLQNAFK